MIIFSPYIIKNDPAARYICIIFMCTLGGRAECTTCAMRFHFKPWGFQGLGTTHLPSLWKAEIAPLGREMTLIHTSCTHTHARLSTHSHTLSEKRVALGRGIPWFQSRIPLKVHECVCLGIKTPALLLLLSRQLCTCVCVLFIHVRGYQNILWQASLSLTGCIQNEAKESRQLFYLWVSGLHKIINSTSDLCKYSLHNFKSCSAHEFHVAFLSH